jgi:hypothetical protein
MNRSQVTRRRTVSTVLLTVLVLVGAGCGKQNAGSGTDSSRVVSSQTATDTTPATEGTGPESPQQSKDAGPVAHLPSLPIGGDDPDQSGDQQCATVNWLGDKPIPPGVTITIDTIGFDLDGFFRLGGSLCDAGAAPCTTSWRFTADTEDDSCAVAVTQIKDVDNETQVQLVLAGTIYCTTQIACDDYAAKSGGGSQIAFTAEPDVIEGSSSSGSSSSSSSSSDESSSSSDSSSGS